MLDYDDCMGEYEDDEDDYDYREDPDFLNKADEEAGTLPGSFNPFKM